MQCRCTARSRPRHASGTQAPGCTPLAVSGLQVSGLLLIMCSGSVLGRSGMRCVCTS